jgi:uncharacterized protein (TIGR02001 family)
MKLSQKAMASVLAASMLASAAYAPTASAGVSATAGVASTYLWRGYDVGSGTPAVSGDLKFSEYGFYTGVWGGSGDTANGTEYDLYLGYGNAVGDFKYDLSVWNYNYPTGPVELDPGDIADAVIALGYGPVMFTAYVPVGEDSGGDYMYYTLGGTFGSFSVLLGMHQKSTNVLDDEGDVAYKCPADDTDGECSPVHLNVTYAYNANLSFTLSQFVVDGTDDDDLKFVVSYSLPISK